MAITVTDIKTKFPQFTDLDDAYIQIFLDESIIEIDESVFDRYYDIALGYLTAHKLEIMKDAQNSFTTNKDLKEEEIADLKIVYQSNSDVADFNNYKLTIFGKKFLEIRKKAVPNVFIV